MNTPHDDAPDDVNLYCLWIMSKDQKAVLRTRLLFEEGLFCSVCHKRELRQAIEIQTLQCDNCNKTHWNDALQ